MQLPKQISMATNELLKKQISAHNQGGGASWMNSHHMEQAWTPIQAHSPLQIQGTVMNLELWFIQQIPTSPGAFEIDSGICREGKKSPIQYRAHEKGLETCTLLGCKLLIVHRHFVYFYIVKKQNFCLTITVQFKPIKTIFFSPIWIATLIFYQQ